MRRYKLTKSRKKQIIVSLLGTFLLGTVLGCYEPKMPEEFIAESPNSSKLDNAKVLYLDVSFDGTSYQVEQVTLFDSVYTRVPIIQIYGLYGVHVISDDDEIIFDQYIWMDPIRRVRIPFSDETAFIDFIQRSRGDNKNVIGRFTRKMILDKAGIPEWEQ